jgi:hypothetical protein
MLPGGLALHSLDYKLTGASSMNRAPGIGRSGLDLRQRSWQQVREKRAAAGTSPGGRQIAPQHGPTSRGIASSSAPGSLLAPLAGKPGLMSLIGLQVFPWSADFRMTTFRSPVADAQLPPLMQM